MFQLKWWAYFPDRYGKKSGQASSEIIAFQLKIAFKSLLFRDRQCHYSTSYLLIKEGRKSRWINPAQSAGSLVYQIAGRNRMDQSQQEGSKENLGKKLKGKYISTLFRCGWAVFLITPNREVGFRLKVPGENTRKENRAVKPCQPQLSVDPCHGD